MRKFVHIYILINIFIGVFFIQHVDAYTFTRTLKVGDSGEDVYELQKVLNSKPETQIALTGNGSPGNETRYFGPKTKEAVKKFQLLYAETILKPLGLTEPTGFVGYGTIAFLNKLNQQYTLITDNPNQDDEDQEDTEDDKEQEDEDDNENPKFDFAVIEEQAYGAVNPGTIEGYSNKPVYFYPQVLASHAGMRKWEGRREIIVDKPVSVGAGFDMTTVDFFLADKKLDKRCRATSWCEIYLPHEFSPGEYKMRTSDPQLGYHMFKIVSMSVGYPEVSTDIVKLGEDEIISGRNFGNNMRVYTPFGVYKTDSENNKFILNIPKEDAFMDDEFQGVLYIENQQGLRSNLKMVTYEK